MSKKFIIPGKTKIETRDDGTIIEQNAANFRQSNFYLRISNGLERFNSFEIVESTPDTTRVKVNNPLQNVFSLNPGFYKLYQWQSKWVLSWAVSTNFSFIANSTRHLKETYLSLNSQTLINNENVSTILQSEKQVPYFNGDGDKEVYIVPRGDLFLRYRLGDNQPVLGFLFSYSPLFSSLVKTRNSFSFGPTFGYDNLPDQVIFAILNEINQGLDGKYKYALTFQASFPVKFK